MGLRHADAVTNLFPASTAASAGSAAAVGSDATDVSFSERDGGRDGRKEESSCLDSSTWHQWREDWRPVPETAEDCRTKQSDLCRNETTKADINLATHATDRHTNQPTDQPTEEWIESKDDEAGDDETTIQW